MDTLLVITYATGWALANGWADDPLTTINPEATWPGEVVVIDTWMDGWFVRTEFPLRGGRVTVEDWS